MVNRKKLYLMIGLARYREKNKDKNLRVNKFDRSDYIGMALMKNFFLITVAYALLIGLFLIFGLNWLVSHLGEIPLDSVIRLIAIGYLIMLVLYSIIVYIQASIRYSKMEKSVRHYAHQLDKLIRYYDEVDTRAEQRSGQYSSERNSDK